MATNRSPVSLALLFVFLGGCAAEGKGPESPPFDDGKDDSFRKPTWHGTIDIHGAPEYAELTADAQYHAWDFELLDEAVVSMGTDYDNRDGFGPEVDTIIYLYRQQSDGRWGRYIARNDESEQGWFSAILDMSLIAANYRLLVKGFDDSVRGPFMVQVACQFGPGCEARPDHPTAEECADWEAALDDCRAHGASLEECAVIVGVGADTLAACCDADPLLFFCQLR